ncbi:metal dependent phosphohydrolase (plasmid) [Deinococcus proteolyticus MRP]|uniref:Metal dependent phosphohydrolase n=1 Tax=Deinococcus proteolyticus (strain ATCC 35074 / DSM 20540 / JCM 6276 / NBRC 101906 / NCIMB 13154 / VKM Ac-1939 / CCM 2703 / MRP) TaxID=693977 RepID=F0RPK4_DEIPM|nr:HD domain-containing protein [Deinococcus proteolyticus]ADY27310.1 metal dependent phosphohydrolase [Deinococcus proteolyticus MRP]
MTSRSSFPLTDRFSQALLLATHWHHGQYRKVGPEETPSLPYISHLLGVASVALEFGASEDEAIAALLHDALEDGPANTGQDAERLRTELLDRFGLRVTVLVDDATDAAPRAGQPKAPWAERKRTYLNHLGDLPASSLLVSAADKLHNVRTMLVDVLALPARDRAAYFERFQQGQLGTLQYYRALADAFISTEERLAERPRLLELFRELERTVSALETACGLSSDEIRRAPGPLA